IPDMPVRDSASQAVDKANEHGYNSVLVPLSDLRIRQVHALPCDQDIQACGTLQSGAVGSLQVPGTIPHGVFPVPFGYVEWTAGGGAIELVQNVRRTVATGPHFCPPRDEGDGFLVDVQSFMVEVERHRRSSSLDGPRTLTPTLTPTPTPTPTRTAFE